MQNKKEVRKKRISRIEEGRLTIKWMNTKGKLNE